MELDPTLADAWNNLGAALYFLGRPEEALQAWETAVEQDPSQYETLFNIGIKAPELGRLDQARGGSAALHRYRSRAAVCGRYRGGAAPPASTRRLKGEVFEDSGAAE